MTEPYRDHKIYHNNGSFFHDIILYPESSLEIVNMVVEIPQYETAKMEISKELPLNPIVFDLRNNKVRHVTYHAINAKKNGYPFIYGALPMTWESIIDIDGITGKVGDNDPIDIFDISSVKSQVGDIRKVKILGAFSMIDNNATDWKLIGINVIDPNYDKYDDVTDLSTTILDTLDDFLTNYKHVPNEFGTPKLINKIDAIELVKQTHLHWKKLINNKEHLDSVHDDIRSIHV